MTSTPGNGLSPRYTVLTVLTVRQHRPVASCAADDNPKTTVRRPSSTGGAGVSNQPFDEPPNIPVGLTCDPPPKAWHYCAGYDPGAPGKINKEV